MPAKHFFTSIVVGAALLVVGFSVAALLIPFIALAVGFLIAFVYGPDGRTFRFRFSKREWRFHLSGYAVAGLTILAGAAFGLLTFPSVSTDCRGRVRQDIAQAAPIPAAPQTDHPVDQPAQPAADSGYGSLVGRFVWEGKLPDLPLLIKKGNTAIRDAAVCAATDLADESLVVDDQTRGIRNIFVYLKKAHQIHPDLEASPTQEVVFDQKSCRFLPHALFVRVGQSVRALSDDPFVHNVHSSPIRNQLFNQLLLPSDRKGLLLTASLSEPFPTQVKCEIHPWMSAYWLILDHPYAAISGPDGSFAIENLPAGDHNFTVWHEKKGYLERALKVTIEPGKTTTLPPMKLGAEDFGFARPKPTSR